MKIKKQVWAVGILIIIMGCATTQKNVEIGGYSFTLEGKTYHIQSVTPRSEEGYNILVQTEGGKTVFKGIDKEQDGILDKVLIGNIPLEKAREIYRKGIALGKSGGHVKKRAFERVYKISDMLNNYILRTYILALGEVYNKLSIIKKQTFTEQAVVVDLGANGNLDKFEKGTGKLKDYQKLYDKVLERGVKEGKITHTKDGMYKVLMK